MTDTLMKMLFGGEWDESKHPRAKDGKFGEGSSEDSSDNTGGDASRGDYDETSDLIERGAVGTKHRAASEGALVDSETAFETGKADDHLGAAASHLVASKLHAGSGNHKMASYHEHLSDLHDELSKQRVDNIRRSFGYNPNQSRDDRGRFGEGSGGDRSGSTEAPGLNNINALRTELEKHILAKDVATASRRAEQASANAARTDLVTSHDNAAYAHAHAMEKLAGAANAFPKARELYQAHEEAANWHVQRSEKLVAAGGDPEDDQAKLNPLGMSSKLNALLFGFNPDQPRDPDGKFGDGSGGEAKGTAAAGGVNGNGHTERDIRVKEKIDNIVSVGEKKIAELEKAGKRGSAQWSKINKAIEAAHAATEDYEELGRARRIGEPIEKIRQLSQAANGAYVNASELASKANFTAGMEPSLYRMLFGGKAR